MKTFSKNNRKKREGEGSKRWRMRRKGGRGEEGESGPYLQGIANGEGSKGGKNAGVDLCAPKEWQRRERWYRIKGVKNDIKSSAREE